MKRKKGFLSGLLVLALLPVLGANAFAEEAQEPEENWVRLSEAYYYEGKLNYETEIFYSPDGKTAEYRTHTLNSDGTESLEIEIYFYNQEDQITRTETSDAETGELLERSEWEYDREGRLQRILRYDPEGSLRNEQRNNYYSGGTSTIRGISYDDNGDVLSQWINCYNENHENYSYASFNEEGECVYVREFDYDESGRKVSGTQEGYGSRSSLRFLYDGEGVLQEQIETQEAGYTEGQVSRTLYYYDEQGNVTEEVTLRDGEVSSRVLRTWGPPRGAPGTVAYD